MNQKGYVALLTILIISAVSLAISISISLLGVGTVKSSLDLKKGQEAQVLIDGCLEETMLRLRNDENYPGASNFSVGDGVCNINVTGTGSDRNITILAQIQTDPSYAKRIQVLVRRVGKSINIISYNNI